MEALKLKDFLDYRYISNLKGNSKEDKLAFTLVKADEEKNEYLNELYILENDKANKIVNLKKDSQFIWENDDTILCAYKKDKKDEKKGKEKFSVFYRYHLNDKKLEPAFELPMPVQLIQVLDEDRILVSARLSSDEHHLYLDDLKHRKDLLKSLKESDLYEEICEIPFYSNGAGFIANKRQQLFIYHQKTKTLDLLVSPSFGVERVVVSKNSKKVFYTGGEAKPVRSLTSRIYVYHVDTKITEVLYQEDNYSIMDLFIVKDKIIVEASDMKKFGLNQDGDFFELKNKKLELFKSYGLTTSTSVGTDSRFGGSPQSFVNDDKIYFIHTNDDHTDLMSLDLKGNLVKRFEMDGSIDGIQMINGKLFLVGLLKQKLQEIYSLDDNKLKQLTRFNAKPLKNKYVAKPKTIILKQKDHEVKGFVLYPKDFDQNKTYPAILDIHGGPKTVYGKVFYHEMQVWANLGYFVLFANPRGSDGKGSEFADIRGKYGTIDYEDLMNFTDLVLKKTKQIDVDKLFVTGGSYGGFMTNWIVGHTNRFKAAATQRSISNWLSFHGTSDIGFYFSKDQTNGHPLLDTDLLWQQSPIKYAMNVKTPLLFIHSDEDYRCPIEQAMQYYSILREKGLDTKFVWFKGETHELSRGGKPQARVKRLKEITDWFLDHN